MSEKTPTIEQKSTFASKTKEGSDVEFVATIKFYINPAGDVRINAPGSASSGSSGQPSPGHQGGGGNVTVKVEESEKAGVAAEETKKTIQIEIDEGGEKGGKGDKTKDDKTGGGKSGDGKSSNGKFPPHKEVDKQIPRTQGDCPITQFIPDPCRAIDDLTKSIKGFFWGSSGGSGCPPCPSDASNFAPTPEPKQLVAGKQGHEKDQTGSEVMDKELKYEV